MKKRVSVQVVAIVLCGLLASPALSPLSAASPATMGRVVAKAPATLNGVAVPQEATLFSGDRLTTGDQGWARVYLSASEKIFLDSSSEARASRRADGISIELTRGGVHLQTGANVSLTAGGLEVVPREKAVWQVRQTSLNEVVVVALKGSVEVRGSNRTVEVPAGRSARVTATPPPPAAAAGGGSYGLSPGAKAGIAAAIIGGIVALVVIAYNQTENDSNVSPNGL
ncbi:MAG TPA: hypothetical protein VNN18_12540 [Candidatus Xenobia bacterium]|nr:hypothetical protein [Candidatus Xenobia bacterium]